MNASRFSFTQPIRETRLSTLLAWNLAVSAIIFFLLQMWRPCYFLTDDNLAIGLPFFTEVGRHLKSFQSPFVSDYIFGGHYNLLRDISFLCWHPLYLLASLCADTPARFWILDIIAFFLLLFTDAGFATLAHRLSRELDLRLSQGWLLFYTQSFVYSTFILACGPSWLSYLANQSALPWLALGLLQTEWRRGVGLIALLTVHQILGGYLGATISNGLIFTLFAASIAFYRRSWLPLIVWGSGNVLALIVTGRFLVLAVDGFLASERSFGLSIDMLSQHSVPFNAFPLSYFIGNFSQLSILDPFNSNSTFPKIRMLLACAAAWCVIPQLISFSRWHFFDRLSIAFAALLAILIIRPNWINQVMLYLPILRSMRWPFREILQFQFFIHFFLVVRARLDTTRFQNTVAILSFLAFAVPLPFLSPPTMNALAFDRKLLFSGKVDKFWAGVKTHLKPDDEIATVIDANLYHMDGRELPNETGIPYSLLAVADFPMYLRVRSVTGYSTTTPCDQLRGLRLIPFFWFGAFENCQIPELFREKPHIKLIVLEARDPMKISLVSKDNPPIDLTPCLSN